jgi:methionyl-tRNA formyltransferase
MRLAFMGTPDFAVAALAELVAAGHEIVAVYTRAPQPSGRGQNLRKSPVHLFAEAQGLAVRTPTSLKSAEEKEAFAALDLDAAVVVAYGLLLPQAILDAPRFGAFNLHASLLPRWRGAAPIQRAIMAGDPETGVEVMRMERTLDTGPILLCERVVIGPEDTAETLANRLSHLGASLLPRALAAVERGEAQERPQASDGVTYAEKITPADARIDWTEPSFRVDRRIRGLSPVPGAYVELRGAKGPERLKALLSRAAQGKGAPGDILEAEDRLVVACGAGAVELLKVQRAGKAAQSAAEFLRGFALRRGDKL